MRQPWVRRGSRQTGKSANARGSPSDPQLARGTTPASLITSRTSHVVHGLYFEIYKFTLNNGRHFATIIQVQFGCFGGGLHQPSKLSVKSATLSILNIEISRNPQSKFGTALANCAKPRIRSPKISYICEQSR